MLVALVCKLLFVVCNCNITRSLLAVRHIFHCLMLAHSFPSAGIRLCHVHQPWVNQLIPCNSGDSRGTIKVLCGCEFMNTLNSLEEQEFPEIMVQSE